MSSSPNLQRSRRRFLVSLTLIVLRKNSEKASSIVYAAACVRGCYQMRSPFN